MRRKGCLVLYFSCRKEMVEGKVCEWGRWGSQSEDERQKGLKLGKCRGNSGKLFQQTKLLKELLSASVS